jgi:hypothetical protein
MGSGWGFSLLTEQCSGRAYAKIRMDEPNARRRRRRHARPLGSVPAHPGRGQAPVPCGPFERMKQREVIRIASAFTTCHELVPR